MTPQRTAVTVIVPKPRRGCRLFHRHDT